MPVTAQAQTAAQELIDFIDASPSPWHAVASAEARLLAQGFTRLEEGARWQLAAGGRYYVVRGGASLIAFVLGSGPLAESRLPHRRRPYRFAGTKAQAEGGLVRRRRSAAGG